MDKYIEQLYKPVGPWSQGYRSDSTIKKVIIEDVTRIEFKHLYANLLIKFHNYKVLEKFDIVIDIKIIDNIKELLSLERLDINQRTWLNTIYNRELLSFRDILFNLYHQYLELLYKDLSKINKFLYIDVDVMFIIGNHSIECDLPIGKIEVYDYAIFYNMKRYVLHKNNQTTFKGIDSNDPKKTDLLRNAITSIIKEHNRDKKINEILN